MTNPYRTSAPREPRSEQKRRVSWARLGAGAALVAAVVPLRAPSAPSEWRRETARRPRSETRGLDASDEERLRRAVLADARARMLSCPEAGRDACRRAVARDVLAGVVPQVARPAPPPPREGRGARSPEP